MNTQAHGIVARVCNEHRNSDLRADNPAILRAFDEELHAKDVVIALLKATDTKLRAINASLKAALAYSTPKGMGRAE